MSNDVAALTKFEPGIYIRIVDVMTGIRKLARVTEEGNGYIDLDDEDATPLPIYAALQPEEVGNMLGWGLHLVDRKPGSVTAWRDLCERLVSSGAGALFYNRAAHWAFTQGTFDFDRAMAAAKEETETVARGRRMLDDMIRNAGGAA